jgi:hypothetical protein
MHPSILAHAFLTIVAEHARAPGQARQTAVTRNQIAHRYTALISHPARAPGTGLRWSQWRQRHKQPRPCTPPLAASRPRTIRITIDGGSIKEVR